MAEIAKVLSHPSRLFNQKFSFHSIQTLLTYTFIRVLGKRFCFMGKCADWDLHFINEMPRVLSYITLARELETLVNYFGKDSREWNKAKGLRKELKVSFFS